MTEAYALLDDFKHGIAFLQRDVEVIQIRRFCRPRFHRCQIHFLAAVIGQQLLNGRSLRSIHIDTKHTLAINIILIDGDVLDMNFRTGVEIHLAGNTRKAPEVLVFEPRAVAPAHYLHGNEVCALLQILGDVELGSYLRVLRVAHVLAVDPDAEVARGRAYMEIDLLTVPVGGKLERAAVRACVVVGFADVGWIVVERRTPGIAGILVGLVAIALNLEESGYGEVNPLRVVELQ